VEKEHGAAIAEAFFVASRSGDMKVLAAMLATDVSLHADGGGKRPALTEPVLGFDAVMKVQELLAGLLKGKPSKLLRVVFINGLRGFITL
jgi:RNA polymerase sigma-70 factor, ECF subfamily